MANVVAGVASLLSKKHSGYDLANLVVGGTEAERETLEQFLMRNGTTAAQMKNGAILMTR